MAGFEGIVAMEEGAPEAFGASGMDGLDRDNIEDHVPDDALPWPPEGGPVLDRPLPPIDGPVVDRPWPPIDGPVIDRPRPTDDGPVVDIPWPTDDGPVVDIPWPPDDGPVIDRPWPPDDGPVIDRPWLPEGVPMVENLIPNKEEGLRREADVEEELKEQYPESEGYTVLSEVYLRDKDGNIVKDPETGEGRRIDFVVVDKDGNVVDSVEVTSKNADKTDQTSKEERIRENGGNYIKTEDGTLAEIPDNVQTRIERRD